MKKPRRIKAQDTPADAFTPRVKKKTSTLQINGTETPEERKAKAREFEKALVESEDKPGEFLDYLRKHAERHKQSLEKCGWLLLTEDHRVKRLWHNAERGAWSSEQEKTTALEKSSMAMFENADSACRYATACEWEKALGCAFHAGFEVGLGHARFRQRERLSAKGKNNAHPDRAACMEKLRAICDAIGTERFKRLRPGEIVKRDPWFIVIDARGQRQERFSPDTLRGMKRDFQKNVMNTVPHA